MKKVSNILLLFFITCPFLSFSQKDSSGIYFTSNDYINHKLGLSINCKNEKHKIKADMVFHQNKISIKHHDSTYTYPKDSVYGIRYCDGSIVRLFNNSEFPLTNPGEFIMIYKVEKGTGMKNDPIVINYFFSKDPTSEILKLTIYNLKAAFPNNHKFHDLIDMEFHSDNELVKYDSFHQMSRINKLYLTSIN